MDAATDPYAPPHSGWNDDLRGVGGGGGRNDNRRRPWFASSHRRIRHPSHPPRHRRRRRRPGGGGDIHPSTNNVASRSQTVRGIRCRHRRRRRNRTSLPGERTEARTRRKARSTKFDGERPRTRNGDAQYLDWSACWHWRRRYE